MLNFIAIDLQLHARDIHDYASLIFETPCRCAHRAQTTERRLQCRGGALCRLNMSYQAVARNVRGSGKGILDPHPDSD